MPEGCFGDFPWQWCRCRRDVVTRVGGATLRRRITETHKHGSTKGMNAGEEPQVVNPTDLLYGELRIADILRGSIRTPGNADHTADVAEPKRSQE